MTIGVDATLVTSHSDKEGAAGTYKGGYGFHPILAYCDEPGEALAGLLRPGNAGSNTAADHIAVIQDALVQVPGELIETIEILVRTDSAGATHEGHRLLPRASVALLGGLELTDAIRDAILKIPDNAWVCALASDGSERENGQIAEITTSLDLTGWPTGSRVIVRRERAHPGAQLSFTDHDGHRFLAVLTDQTSPDIQILERRQRERAHADADPQRQEHRPAQHALSATSSTTASGLRSSRSRTTCSPGPGACCLTASSPAQNPSACATGCCTSAAPLAFHARKATLRIHHACPWAAALVDAFTRARALPAPA